MPIRRWSVRRRTTEVTFEQRLAFMIGDHLDHPQFKSAEQAREAWLQCRDEILEQTGPGHRPPAWWQFDAKEDRDHSMTEASQLFEMGEIDDAEAQRCREEWAHYEQVALGMFEWRRDFFRRPETGQADYHRRRSEMGIADEILPPTMPRPAPGWEDREKDILTLFQLEKLAKAKSAA